MGGADSNWLTLRSNDLSHCRTTNLYGRNVVSCYRQGALSTAGLLHVLPPFHRLFLADLVLVELGKVVH